MQTTSLLMFTRVHVYVVHALLSLLHARTHAHMETHQQMATQLVFK